jgi:uncharacterized membrane protein
MKKTLAILLIFFAFAPHAFAQDDQNAIPDTVTTVKAQVLNIESSETKQVPGTDVTSVYQTIDVQILEGAEKGKTVTVDNDYLSLTKGEVFYLQTTIRGADGIEIYAVSDPYRIPTLIFFVVLFVVLVLVFGGVQGIRGILSLIGSLALITYVLIPGILSGYSPILLSLGVSALIIIVGSYITHGFNRTTTSAVFGMLVTIVITGLLAYAAVHFARLSGFATEETVYLNMNTRGSINFIGLLLGGILIGLLGILYDVAIGQAIAVEELHTVAPHLPRAAIYKRAIRIGREHIGALVNMLAIAYVGVSLPLILLYATSANASFAMTVNREIFATEIIRAMVGSIGLVLAVPITTIISVWFLIQMKEVSGDEERIKREEEIINQYKI